MSEVETAKKEISITRRELKNIRQEIMKMKAQFKAEVAAINALQCMNHQQSVRKEITKNPDEMCFPMVPIGVISSCFKSKNGIPRQPSLCQSAKATLEINKTHFTNPKHSLIGLEEFPYIWVLFIFHKNGPDSSVKAKVHPPRLAGASVGVFGTRSPHRPCAIGLSLIKLDKVLDNKLYLSGVDLLDGTPVLDVKPYIAAYDTPNISEEPAILNAKVNFPVESMKNGKSMQLKEGSMTIERSINEWKTVKSSLKLTPESKFEDKSQEEKKEIINGNSLHNNLAAINKMPSRKFKNTESSLGENLNSSNKFQSMFSNGSVANLLNEPLNHLKVVFTSRAENDIEMFHALSHDPICGHCLEFIDGTLEAKKAIIEVLQNDPRSVYRKNKCSDKLYFFELDKMHVTCWFDDKIAEILRIKPAGGIRTNGSE